MNKEAETHFEKLYMQHAKLIEHLANECIELKEKFGSKSKLYQSRLKTVQFLRQFHDETIDYLQTMEKAFITLQASYNMQRIQLVSIQANLPMSETIKMISGNDNELKLKIDNANLITERLFKQTGKDADILFSKLIGK